jgi:hypothetical protein
MYPVLWVAFLCKFLCKALTPPRCNEVVYRYEAPGKLSPAARPTTGSWV